MLLPCWDEVIGGLGVWGWDVAAVLLNFGGVGRGKEGGGVCVWVGGGGGGEA